MHIANSAFKPIVTTQLLRVEYLFMTKTAKQRLIDDWEEGRQDAKKDSPKLESARLEVKERNTAKKRVLSETEASKTSTEKKKSRTNMDTQEEQEEQEEQDPQAFRANIAKVYLKNKLSAKDTAELVRNAYKSGTQGMDDTKPVGKTQPKTHSETSCENSKLTQHGQTNITLTYQ